MKAFVAAIMACFLLSSLAERGVDTSTLVSVSDYECMKRDGFGFAVSRVYEETGRCDTLGLQSIKNAHAAGMKMADGYHFPDQRQSPAAQIEEVMKCIRSSGAKVDRVWIDIEGGWGPNKAGNARFIHEMSEALKKHKMAHGVYTNANSWGSITGDSRLLSNVSLWWAYWDNSPSWSHWAPFGGWRKPQFKQYHGSATLCGAGVDLNYRD